MLSGAYSTLHEINYLSIAVMDTSLGAQPGR